MDTNFLLNAGTKFLNDMIQNVTESLVEPDSIDVAIEMYEKRLGELRKMKDDGFRTVSSWKEYEQAKKIVEQYQKNI